MESSKPLLKFLHANEDLNLVKLNFFRRLPVSILKSSLLPGQTGSLKVRPDGTVLDGHHRLKVLSDAGEDIHKLPREIIEKRESYDS